MFISGQATYDPMAMTNPSMLVKQRRHKLAIERPAIQMENHDEKHDVPHESLPLPNQKYIGVTQSIDELFASNSQSQLRVQKGSSRNNSAVNIDKIYSA